MSRTPITGERPTPSPATSWSPSAQPTSTTTVLVGVDDVGGGDFVVAPAVSPDGGFLAWLRWDHPDMPWDAAELWAGRLVTWAPTAPRSSNDGGSPAAAPAASAIGLRPRGLGVPARVVAGRRALVVRRRGRLVAPAGGAQQWPAGRGVR